MSRTTGIALFCALTAAGCASTQRATFNLATPTSGASIAKERGMGMLFIAEPFCIVISEGATAHVRVSSLGPALLPLVPIGNLIEGSHSADELELVIEIVSHGQAFDLPTQGIAVHFADGFIAGPRIVQVSYFSSHREETSTPFGPRFKESSTWIQHDKPVAYSQLAPTLEVLDTVRLTLMFKKPEGSPNPISLDFPSITTADVVWHMPPIAFSEVTRTKYNPGGGVMADGTVVGSWPVTDCRDLGHPHR